MKILILMTLSMNTLAQASSEGEHSHSLGGELEHAWPVAVAFIVLVTVGFIYNHFSKKN
mgnify:FL=1|jgi:hypothetical protein